MSSTAVRTELHEMSADDFPRWYQEALDSSSTGNDSAASTDRRRRSRHGRGTTPPRTTSPSPTPDGDLRATEESFLGVDLCGSTLSTPTQDQGGSTSTAPPLLLTIEQAAKRLTVGRCTMQDLVISKEVRSFKIGKLRRIPPEALDEYIARKMQS